MLWIGKLALSPAKGMFYAAASMQQDGVHQPLGKAAGFSDEGTAPVVVAEDV